MKIENVVVISLEDYTEYQELKKSQCKRLADLKYCMQSNGTWYHSKYKLCEYKPNFNLLHKVNYEGVDYDMIVIGENLFLGHVL